MRQGRSFLPCLVAAASVLASSAGCDSTHVELEKAPLVQIPERKAPNDQPKDLRPRGGSSANMNYDPSGVNGGPR